MYGKSTYGLSRYGRAAATDMLDPEAYFVDLAKYVPPFMREIRELAEIYKTEGYEIGLLEYYIDDLLAQVFIPTATWGLTMWEETYGVTTNFSLTHEQRREILYAKIRGQGTTTIDVIRQTAESYSGGKVEVIEDNANHIFTIRFVGIKGIPRNMKALINTLEDIKPAHLSYQFEYRYTIWNSLAKFKWNGLMGTWDEVRVMKEDD